MGEYLSENHIETIDDLIKETNYARWRLKKMAASTWAIQEHANELNDSDKVLVIGGDKIPGDEFAIASTVEEVRIHVEEFHDGRFFSVIRRLRERCQYQNLISISGNFSIEQVTFMQQLGAGAFDFETDEAAFQAQSRLNKELTRVSYRTSHSYRRK